MNNMYYVRLRLGFGTNTNIVMIIFDVSKKVTQVFILNYINSIKNV